MAWEYLAVALDFAFGIKRPRYVNQHELADWQLQPGAIDYFNQLGSDGWEMIAAPGSLTDEYIFKRQRGVMRPAARRPKTQATTIASQR